MEKDDPRQKNVDSETIRRAVEGDSSALALIYDCHIRPIYRYVYSRVGNKADAEDLTSQTFTAVLENLPRYKHRHSFTAWVYQIARNKLIDHYRRQPDPRELDEQAADPAWPDALESIILNESRERLRSLLRALDAGEHELLHLRYTAELSFVEIAQILGRKEDAVRKSIRRILDRLALQMEAQNV